MDLSDLTTYPANKIGAKRILDDMRPYIIELWRKERIELRTDDLVAVIDTSTSKVHIHRRTKVQGQIRKDAPDLEILDFLTERPDAPAGTIKIWAMIGYTQQVCIVPLAVAYS